MDYAAEANCYLPTLGLVEAIYNDNHLSSASPAFKDYLYGFVTAPACDLLLTPNPYRNFSTAEVAYCRTLNNATFSRGAVNNLYYSQRKIEERTTEMYAAKNFTPNTESNLTYPPYFLTNEYA
jgi:hypothetical protein